MQRILKSERMEGGAPAWRYAAGDFEETDDGVIELFQACFDNIELDGYVLDLGCGTGDISLRLAERYPECIVHGVDSSSTMRAHAEQALARRPELTGCVEFLPGRLPALDSLQANYQAVVSNHLLHRLHDPMALWHSILAHGAPGAPVLVVDLQRPGSETQALRLVERYAATAPELLRRDFLHALLAAFEPDEVRDQIARAGLRNFDVRSVTDRHLAIVGRLPRH